MSDLSKRLRKGRGIYADEAAEALDAKDAEIEHIKRNALIMVTASPKYKRMEAVVEAARYHSRTNAGAPALRKALKKLDAA